MTNFQKLEAKVLFWAANKGLTDSNNAKNQTLKMCAEAGEVADAVLKDDKKEVMMEVGDVLVTLSILGFIEGFTLEEAFEVAYNKIKDRKGKTVNGTFIKE